MNANVTTGGDLDISVDDFAAELAQAAYPIVLRNAPAENWLDLELELWRAMKETVGKWAQDWPQAGVILVCPLEQESDSHEVPLNRRR
jgi:hypothetical protein